VKHLALCMVDHDASSNRQAEEIELRRLLAAVAQHRDHGAFALFFDRMAPRIKSFMLRKKIGLEMAEDVVQETMVTIWTKAGLYDPDKGSVMAWTYTIARNLRIDRLRRDPAGGFTDLDDYLGISDEPAADDVLASRQQQQLVTTALQGIPDEQKQILMLSYIDGFPQSAIAEQLKLPLGTVKSRMRLAYERLRKVLEHAE
jgi:RNA polymerase sigma-70 factor, ECF subfamily